MKMHIFTIFSLTTQWNKLSQDGFLYIMDTIQTFYQNVYTLFVCGFSSGIQQTLTSNNPYVWPQEGAVSMSFEDKQK